jgi:hypothetical protein
LSSHSFLQYLRSIFTWWGIWRERKWILLSPDSIGKY